VTISPTDAQTILVGIESGAVVRTTDGGDTWEGHRPGAIRDCHVLSFHGRRGEYVYEGGGFGGAFSRDAGRTWSRARGLGRIRYGWAAVGDAEDPELRYLSAAHGVRSAHGAKPHGFVLRSRGEEPWRVVLDVGAMPYALISAAGSLYAGLSDGRVLETTDTGQTWHLLPFHFSSIERALIRVEAR